MRAHLIVNPRSGNDRGLPMVPLITDRLSQRFDAFDVTIANSADEARQGAGRAMDQECSALYVAGGDGTLNAVLRGMSDRPSQGRPTLGIVPLGTGNDFAKALDLGEDVETALDRLADPWVIDVDEGVMNDRPFVNTSAGGFIADTSEMVTAALKDVAGKLAYVIGGARALLRTEPLLGRLLAPSGPDGAHLAPAGDTSIQMFAVCNARFIGGGYAIAPDALIDDGLLDVLVVPHLSLVEFLAVLKGIAASGDPGHEGVLHFRTRTLELQFDRAANVNVDGEVLETRRCSYGIRPRALQFFCGPAPLAAAQPARREWAA